MPKVSFTFHVFFFQFSVPLHCLKFQKLFLLKEKIGEKFGVNTIGALLNFTWKPPETPPPSLF